MKGAEMPKETKEALAKFVAGMMNLSWAVAHLVNVHEGDASAAAAAILDLIADMPEDLGPTAIGLGDVMETLAVMVAVEVMAETEDGAVIAAALTSEDAEVLH